MTTLAAIAEAFNAQAVHVEPSVLTGWLAAHVLDGLAEGELWIAKDLTAEACPRSTWIEGRPMYANDWTAVDAQGRARAFRRLDREWYVWLYHAAQRARQSLEQTQPETWREMAARFNALWSVACRWWGRAEVGNLHNDHYLDARYAPPRVWPQPRNVIILTTPITPAASLSTDFNTWPYTLRMEHAAASARRLRDEHSVTTDPRGNYTGPEGLTRDDMVRLAIEAARHVAKVMRGWAAA
jgi:hypothetical protein